MLSPTPAIVALTSLGILVSALPIKADQSIPSVAPSAVTALPVHLPPGSRVKVVERGGRREITGSLVAADQRSITIELEKGGPTTFSRAAIGRLHASAGKKSRTLEGALFGALLSAPVAVILGKACWDQDPCPPPSGKRTTRIAAAIGVMAGLGALIGSTVERERWKELPVGSVTVGLYSTPEGVAAGIRFGF